MKNLMLKILIVALLALASTAQAKVVVLVHGYLGDALSWERSGVNATLTASGWTHAADLVHSPQGIQVFDFDTRASDKRFYAVQLPSQAPLAVQASWLKGALNSVEKRNPDQLITVIGHSAGGVVARLALTSYDAGNVDRLITIAAPHLGTDKAIEALNATNSGGMFGFFKEWIVRDAIGDGLYNTVRGSRGVLVDLLPPQPGSLLYALNQQTHPDIEYISIVRTAAFNIRGDVVVPPVSQDMNRVPALQGKSQLLLTAQGHELSPADGALLVSLL
ncbi:MAG: lipase family alpha/beta hydrolase [bacterium]